MWTELNCLLKLKMRLVWETVGNDRDSTAVGPYVTLLCMLLHHDLLVFVILFGASFII